MLNLFQALMRGIDRFSTAPASTVKKFACLSTVIRSSFQGGS